MQGLGNLGQEGRSSRSASRRVPGYVQRTSKRRFELVEDTVTLTPTTYNRQTIGEDMECFIKIGPFALTIDNAPTVLDTLLRDVTHSTVSTVDGKPLTWIRGHLLNGQLGGSGDDPANLAMLTASANSNHSNGVEDFIKNILSMLGGSLYRYKDTIQITTRVGVKTLDFALQYKVIAIYPNAGKASISAAIPARLICQVCFCVLIDGDSFFDARSALDELNLDSFAPTDEIRLVKTDIEDFFEKSAYRLFGFIPEELVKILDSRITGWEQTVENGGWKEEGEA